MYRKSVRSLIKENMSFVGWFDKVFLKGYELYCHIALAPPSICFYMLIGVFVTNKDFFFCKVSSFLIAAFIC